MTTMDVRKGDRFTLNLQVAAVAAAQTDLVSGCAVVPVDAKLVKVQAMADTLTVVTPGTDPSIQITDGTTDLLTPDLVIAADDTVYDGVITKEDFVAGTMLYLTCTTGAATGALGHLGVVLTFEAVSPDIA